MIIEKKLSNGIRVVAQKLPSYRSVSAGVWMNTGSTKETKQQSGIAHFIEHMMFKGTKNRSAKDIAAEMDGVGGQINAFTAKECTCYYVKVISEYLETGLDVLGDMLMNSVFAQEEIEKEKGVVIEEIGMSIDNPEDYVHELMSRTYYRDHPLAKPILGTIDSVNSMTHEKLIEYVHANYGADNAVISVAGNFEENKLMDQLEKYFGKLEYTPEDQDSTNEKIEEAPGEDQVEIQGSISIAKREIEQVHICLGMPGFAMEDDLRYSMFIFNNLFGASMSSRLFQTIREKHGLAYSVFSYPSTHSDTGMMGIYAGTNPTQLEAVIQLIMQEIKLALKDGVSQSEFEQSKAQLKGNYILSMEGVSSIMMSLGKSKTLLDKVVTEDEIIKKIDSVTIDGVRQAMEHMLVIDKIKAAIVGKVEDANKIQELLQ